MTVVRCMLHSPLCPGVLPLCCPSRVMNKIHPSVCVRSFLWPPQKMKIWFSINSSMHGPFHWQLRKKLYCVVFLLSQLDVNAYGCLPQPSGSGPSGSNSLLAVAANWSWSWARDRMGHMLIISWKKKPQKKQNRKTNYYHRAVQQHKYVWNIRAFEVIVYLCSHWVFTFWSPSTMWFKICRLQLSNTIVSLETWQLYYTQFRSPKLHRDTEDMAKSESLL